MLRACLKIPPSKGARGVFSVAIKQRKTSKRVRQKRRAVTPPCPPQGGNGEGRRSFKSAFEVLFIIVFGVTIFLNCSEANDQTAAIKAAAQAELQRYPQASLLDLYKFFFQGAFGPGHLINDREAAAQYLEEELRASTSFDTVRWQPVGHQGRYYRVNLCLIKEGAIPQQKLFEAFVASANDASPPSLEEWRKEWQMILRVIASMQLDLANFANDQREIEKNLAEGKVIGHHSETFQQLYHPHYRVVDKERFDALFQ